MTSQDLPLKPIKPDDHLQKSHKLPHIRTQQVVKLSPQHRHRRAHHLYIICCTQDCRQAHIYTQKESYTVSLVTSSAQQLTAVFVPSVHDRPSYRSFPCIYICNRKTASDMSADSPPVRTSSSSLP